MKFPNLNLTAVEIDLSKDNPRELYGLTHEEADIFSDKVAKIITKVDKEQLITVNQALKELLPQLTDKEALLLMGNGVKAAIVETLERANDPVKLLKVLSKAGKKR